MAYAYRKLLKVEKGQEDKCVVILMEDGKDSAKVTRGLHKAGVTDPDQITIYMENKHKCAISSVCWTDRLTVRQTKSRIETP